MIKAQVWSQRRIELLEEIVLLRALQDGQRDRPACIINDKTINPFLVEGYRAYLVTLKS